MLPLIDTHCHLDADVFSDDLEAVVNHAISRQVSAMILPATTRQRWVKVKEVSAAHPVIYPAYGLHPCFMRDHRPEDLALLDQWLTDEPCIAVGECGLDFYDRQADRNGQIELFEAQLSLAQQHQLPVIIHARKSVQEVITRLKLFNGISGVLHSYSGSYEQACQLMDLGFYFGYGGPVTWPGSTRLQKVVKQIPLEFLLLETDSPDQPDQTHKLQRNEPGFLADIADFLTKCRGESMEKLAKQTTKNARMLFRLPEQGILNV